jgi:DNA-binding response OmpR family regulator
MPEVVLYGDDAALAGYASALEAQALSVTALHPGTDGVLPETADLVILHLSSAGEDPLGRDLLQAAARGEGPGLLLVVSAESAAFETVRDADDFVRDGATAGELVARVRRILWKLARHDSSDVLQCGELVMDLANYTVHVAGRQVELTYKEYELLRFLAVNRDRVFSRESLLNNVWGYDFYGGARTVDVHIRRLRSKIEDRHLTFIETVRNVGYRFRSLP